LEIDEFEGLEVHLIRENQVISDKSSSHEKFMHGIKVLMAKNYIENLSEEVKKGINKKCELGLYPAKAPTGYKNVDGAHGKRIIMPGYIHLHQKSA
jgi:DNA invertase Pin-like site-specific DNA recombinase